MLSNHPLMAEDSIKISLNGVEVSAENGCVASYNPPFNKIDIKLTLTDDALSYFEVRVTDINEDYDIGVGNLPLKTLQNGNTPATEAFWLDLRANQTHTLFFYITPEGFPMAATESSKSFRVSFYAKNELDGSWNVSYLVFTIDGYQLVLQNGETLNVVSSRERP